MPKSSERFMKIYVDVSALNRIFDNQAQPRIFLESSAMEVVFLMIETGAVDLVSSEVAEFENAHNPYIDRKQFVGGVLLRAERTQQLDESIRLRAREIELLGIDALDALHLACAERSGVSRFLTCDDEIGKKYQGDLSVRNPVDFVREMTGGVKP